MLIEKRLTVRLKGDAPQQLDDLHEYYAHKMQIPSFSQNDALNYIIQTLHQRLKPLLDRRRKKRGKKK